MDLMQRHKKLVNRMKALARKMGLSPYFLFNAAFLQFANARPPHRARMLADYVTWIDQPKRRARGKPSTSSISRCHRSPD